jgi:hypothetical protein
MTKAIVASIPSIQLIKFFADVISLSSCKEPSPTPAAPILYVVSCEPHQLALAKTPLSAITGRILFIPRRVRNQIKR